MSTKVIGSSKACFYHGHEQQILSIKSIYYWESYGVEPHLVYKSGHIKAKWNINSNRPSQAFDWMDSFEELSPYVYGDLAGEVDLLIPSTGEKIVKFFGSSIQVENSIKRRILCFANDLSKYNNVRPVKEVLRSLGVINYDVDNLEYAK